MLFIHLFIQPYFGHYYSNLLDNYTVKAIYDRGVKQHNKATCVGR